MAVSSTVFLLEPDEAVRNALALLLRREGWEVKTFDKALDWQQTDEQAVCLVAEAELPDISAEEIIQGAKSSKIPIIFIGHNITPQSAVDLIHKGALDFLEMPFLQKRLVDLLETLRDSD